MFALGTVYLRPPVFPGHDNGIVMEKVHVKLETQGQARDDLDHRSHLVSLLREE